MVQQFKAALEEAKGRFKEIHIVDFGCGKGYLSFLLAHLFQFEWNYPAKIIGVDSEPGRIKKCRDAATALELSDVLTFVDGTIESFQLPFERVHFVFALHACDTATDDALSFVLQHKVDVFGVAPCCQAEVASQWRAHPEAATSPMRTILHSPLFRREFAATVTDALRMELMRSCGYEVIAHEFVEATHTPKNVLLYGFRRGNYLKDSLKNYLEMKRHFGSPVIKLERLLQPEITGLLAELQ